MLLRTTFGIVYAVLWQECSEVMALQIYGAITDLHTDSLPVHNL